MTASTPSTPTRERSTGRFRCSVPARFRPTREAALISFLRLGLLRRPSSIATWDPTVCSSCWPRAHHQILSTTLSGYTPLIFRQDRKFELCSSRHRTRTPVGKVPISTLVAGGSFLTPAL